MIRWFKRCIRVGSWTLVPQCPFQGQSQLQEKQLDITCAELWFPVQNQPGLPRACHRSWYIKVTRWQGIYHPLLSRSVAPFKMQIQHFLNSMDCIVELTLLIYTLNSFGEMDAKKGDNATSMLYTILKPQLFKTPQSSDYQSRFGLNTVLMVTRLEAIPPDQGKGTWTSASMAIKAQDSENRPMSSSSPPQLCLHGTASTPCKQHAGICAIKRHNCFPATKNKQPTL